MTTWTAAAEPGRGRLPWGVLLFLHFIFLLANLDPPRIPFPASQDASVAAIEQSKEQGMPGRRIGFVLLGAVAGAALARGGARRLRLNGVLGLLLAAYMVWSLLSLAWADDVVLTGKTLIAFALLWTGAVWVGLRLSLHEILEFAFLSNILTWVTCLGIELGFGVFRPWASGYRFAGLYHPNETGQCLGVAVLAATVLFDMSRGRRAAMYFLLGLGAFGFLILTGSRTALLCTVTAMAAMLVIAEVGRHGLQRLGIVLAGVGAVLCAIYLLQGSDWVGRLISVVSLGRDDSDLTTLTQRTPMWKEVIETYIAARPLTGYGYGGFWNLRHIVAMSLLQRGTVYYHSHSGYLEMALSIGIGGAVVHVLTIVLSLARTVAAGLAGDLPRTFAAGLLLMLLVAMSTEAVNMSAYLMPTFLCMALISKFAFVAPVLPAEAEAEEAVPEEAMPTPRLVSLPV
jgi:O-antigen ligase